MPAKDFGASLHPVSVVYVRRQDSFLRPSVASCALRGGNRATSRLLSADCEKSESDFVGVSSDGT